jgi:hypothetical protein
MNEHIRKCCDGAGLDSNWKPGFDSIYGQQLEKFAELIMLECIEAARTVGGSAGVEVETIIRNHFGVEE